MKNGSTAWNGSAFPPGNPRAVRPQVGWSRRRFLGAGVAAAAGAASPGAGLWTPAWAADGPVGGGAGVPPSRLARLATGANLCRWFRFPARDEAGHYESYLREDEAARMVRIGLRHVRLCVAPSVVMESSGALRAERVAWLEAALRRLQAAGLLVVVDLHNEDRQAELDPDWQRAFVAFWGRLAERLANLDPELTVLEFVNEPVFERREGEWNSLNARLAEAVRARAPRHTLMTSGPNWGGIDGLSKLELLPDRNVVYSFHCYDPFPFTHQGATWSSEAVKPLRAVPYPSSPEAVAPLLEGLAPHPASRGMLEKYGRERWNREKLAERFRRAVTWGRERGVPLYCGEFGVYPAHARPEHRAAWFHDFGAVLAENRIGWAVWGWDEGFGFNRRWRDGRLEVDSVVVSALGLKAG